MTAARLFLLFMPLCSMIGIVMFLDGSEPWPNVHHQSSLAGHLMIHAATTLPYAVAAMLGLMVILASARSGSIRFAGWGVSAGSLGVVFLAAAPRMPQLIAPTGQFPQITRDLPQIDGATATGLTLVFALGCFALHVALKGKLGLSDRTPRRILGRRALHGEADWMEMREAVRLFGKTGGIVIGEAYRVDLDPMASCHFQPERPASWGQGGKASLLCFDGSFGSSHGIVFAGSGGFKTTSVTIPTALKWGGTLIVLDPSKEIAPMVSQQRQNSGRRVRILDPHAPSVGFNALDWIGQSGASKEEDIATVASWIMSESGRPSSIRDDFFRASGLQLLTAIIADVCLSGLTAPERQTLRQVRANLAEPEPQLRKRLQEIYDTSGSDFVKENVAAFVNMTPETFSGVYANAIKETHWLSYRNYADLVSGSAFSTNDIAAGATDVFLNIDLKTLETHAGLARVIIGSFLTSIYNRQASNDGRVLFLLDEVARLGYMRILETARDAGRKYGITLTMIYQSLGQLRETYGGRDASSKWFESASWISFAAINDPETAEYISRRCGMTTVEIDSVTRSYQMKGTSKTRSKQLAARPLIQPHEVLTMRTDEQIVFTAGHRPLRCGRAIWFRRKDMRRDDIKASVDRSSAGQRTSTDGG